ncbi:polyhydroxyalkanoic acid system family protein [Aquabacter spiritensis]|uniref:Putative polyhydroxyalkanoic acid system protein n=1 Tax=Aquabacter spiritensis TaxID=933073 RepID=A0A4R3LWS6_9HYPH|nr:polyhydroxyalkanoic acid system family protein [Aquabacter spiritensis]TCT05084.1 putative polyhydroxyalkanoic acid system protein [Aquabacter spiritensis]
MPQPITVSIPHRLGQAEATRRLQTGLSSVRSRFGDKLTVMEETWTGPHLDFRVAVMGQQASGRLDVVEDAVHLEVQLPWLLHVVAEKAKALIDRQGRILLEKK